MLNVGAHPAGVVNRLYLRLAVTSSLPARKDKMKKTFTESEVMKAEMKGELKGVALALVLLVVGVVAGFLLAYGICNWGW